jgi:hypothetical protein
MATDGPVVALAVGDLGAETCGVGSSAGALLARSGGRVRPIDLTNVRRGDRVDGDVLVIAYPSASTFQQPATALAALRLRRAAAGRPVRLWLHEYRRFHRVHRAIVRPLLRLATDRIVVSNEREAAAVRRVAGRRDVVVVPPPNATAPVAPLPPALPSRSHTVGVFGMRRPDKGESWLSEALVRLDARFTRLELAGGGWDDYDAPARFDVVRRGHVPTAQLPELFAGWGLAVAPFWEGAHDGRLSLRTPLAHGVPTLTRRPDGGELTLRPPHLLFDPTDVPDLTDDGRAAGAAAVAAFEADVTAQLLSALADP